MTHSVKVGDIRPWAVYIQTLNFNPGRQGLYIEYNMKNTRNKAKDTDLTHIHWQNRLM